ncbi:MAG: M20 family peptidase [Pseudomonadota bacterium]
MKLLIKIAVAGLVVIATILAWNTAHLPAPAAQVTTTKLLDVDATASAQRLAGAIRIPTISFENRSDIDIKQFDALASYLQNNFPKTHAALTRERLDGGSLLYSWPGKDLKAKPILLLAHMDVVPVEPGTEKQWTHAPFSGEIADGFIWGRGALDDKGNMVALLEGVETLLSQGFKPSRTIYLAFGHDEEIGGDQGAVKMAALLKSRGVKAEFSLDEGGAITQGVIAGVDKPVASIMVAEKGYVSFRLTARAKGGHSSMPPSDTAVGDLSRAVARVQAKRMPGHLTPPVNEMLNRLAPEMPLARRVLMANRWLFEPLLIRAMSAAPVSSALVRTTTAPTMLRAGIKDNVLPTEAYAVINFRLLPGDTVKDVEDHLRDVIDDEHIEIEVDGHMVSEASPVSDARSASFAVIEKTVNQVFPEALVSTGIVTGATDNRHYTDVFESRYNFSPNLFRPEDLARVHGANERIAVQSYVSMIRFYAQLIQNAAGV